MIWRIIKISLVSGLALGVLTTLTLVWALQDRNIPRWGLPVARKFVPGLALGRLELTLWPLSAVHVRAHDVVLNDRDQNEAVMARLADATVDVTALWREGRIAVLQATVEGARVFLTERADGDLTLSALVPPTDPNTPVGPETALYLPALSAGDVTVLDGVVESRLSYPFLIQLAEFRASGWMAGMRAEVSIDALHASFHSADLSIGAKVRGTAHLHDHALTAALDLTAEGVTPDPVGLSIDAEGPLHACAFHLLARQGGQTVLSGDVVVDGGAPAWPTLQARLKLDKVSLGNIGVGVEGDVSGNVVGSLHGIPLQEDSLLDVNAELSRSTVQGQTFDALKVNGSLRGKAFDVRQLSVAWLGAAISGTAKGEIGGGLAADVDALLPEGFVIPVVGLAVSGEAHARVWGSRLETLEGTATVRRGKLTVDDGSGGTISVLHATADVDYSAAKQTLKATAEARVDAETAQASIPLRVRVDATSVLSAEPHGHVLLTVDEGAIAGLKDIRLVFDAEVKHHATRAGLELGIRDRSLVSLTLQSQEAASRIRSLNEALRFPIQAKIHSPWTALSTWWALIPEAPNVTLAGDISLDLKLEGTVRKPTLDVTLATRQAMFDIYHIGDFAFNARAREQDKGSILEASADWNDIPLLKLGGTIGLDVGHLLDEGTTAQKDAELAGAQVRADLEVFPLALQRVVDVLGIQTTIGEKNLPGFVSVKGLVVGNLLKPRLKADAWVDLAAERLTTENAAFIVTAKTRPPYAEHVFADVTARQFDLSVLQGLVPMVRELSGTLNGELHQRGAPSMSSVNGELVINASSLVLRDVPALKDVSTTINVRDGHVSLPDLQAKLARGGSLTATVAADRTAEQTFVVGVDARGDNLAVDYMGLDKVTLDAEVVARVTIMAPPMQSGAASAPSAEPWSIAGDATASNVRVKLPELTELGIQSHGGTGLPADVVWVDSLNEQPVPLDTQSLPLPVVLDLALKVPSLRVRGPDADLTSSTALTVQTNDERRLTLAGQSRIDSGYVMILSRRWDVDSAQIIFDGSDEIDPVLDVRLARQYPDVRVTMGVSGTMKRPQLVLKSDPPGYDKSQLISLVVTGRSDQGKAQGGTDALAAIVMQSLLRGLAGPVTQQIGIDVVRVGVDSQQAQLGQNAKGTRATLEVGKWLTEKLYVGYERGFGASDGTKNTNTLKLEYQLAPRLMLEGAFGDAGVGGLDLLWMYRY